MREENLEFIRQNIKNKKAEQRKEIKRWESKLLLYFKVKEEIQERKWDSSLQFDFYDYAANVYIKTSSPEEDYDLAWSFVSWLQDTFSIKDGDIKKMFASYGNEPRWYWEVRFTDYFVVEVYFAEPDDDCVPVRKSYTSTSWMCEKK